MFRNLTSRHLFVVLAVGILFVFAGAAYAGNGHGHGPLPHSDPPCTASPNPVAVGEPFTLSATGLPTEGTLWVIVQPPSGSGTVFEIWANPDGTWSGSQVADQAGTWTYAFSGMLTNKKYGTVASCSEQVT